MTQLKTLEDLPIWKKNADTTHMDFSKGAGDALIRRDLRAEAIKWIKENYGSENMLQLYDKDESTQSGDHKFSQMVAIRNWIKHFFNITDEELQNEN